MFLFSVLVITRIESIRATNDIAALLNVAIFLPCKTGSKKISHKVHCMEKYKCPGDIAMANKTNQSI